ncbi:helix-turn-helix domain-containing protein [Brachybacterium sacelli]|uniref:Transcriptional regulator with XRE-family HTH domain n=1 Tax=Brachybacterium sacelli TaxID=173364 RepID=A0ABS4X9T0_9MICO|nr:helix-turn-helix transcriptional regulator [Brachybacterium sacelli]MBP2384429.1 transcriptional regulator with XRE-family HTH domain [Brachybacterium sacelli]
MSAPHVDADRLEQRAERLVEDRDELMKSLIALRREHDLTQKDVAERMGVSQPTVAAFEHYDSNPTLATIQRYAMAVDAVLHTRVIDDCGNGIPSDWSDPVERSVRLRTPRRSAPRARFSELTYA